MYDEKSHIYRELPYDSFQASVAAPSIQGVPSVPGATVPTSSTATDMQRGARLTQDMADLASIAGGGNSQAAKAAKTTDSVAKAISTAATVAAMFSDERTKKKRPMYSAMETKDIVPLSDAGARTLQVSPQGRAFYVDLNEQQSVPSASLSGRSSVSEAPKMPAPKAAKAKSGAKPAYRQMTDEELMREVEKMMAQYQAPQGPSAVQPALDRSQYAPMLSDAAAKKAAFADGVRYADTVSGDEEIAAGNKPSRPAELPAYMLERARGRSAIEKGATAATDATQPFTRALDEAFGVGDTARRSNDEVTEPSRPIDRSKTGIAPARVGLRAHDIAHKAAAMAQARRAMAPSAYTYKEQFRPPDQAPGEVNVGPMAQNMAADPIASTAVKKDPTTGMLAIDRDKALKLVMGSLADLQMKQDLERRR